MKFGQNGPTMDVDDPPPSCLESERLRRRRASVHSRALLLALGLVLPLIIIEVLLQAAAWREARRHAASPDCRSGSAIRVLCVGDSFTFGIGATSTEHSYPALLQERLDGVVPGEFQVIAEGWPGRDSSELASQFPEFLAVHRPDAVCILIGVNNRWSQSDAPARNMDAAVQIVREGGALGSRFRWRFRLGRVLRLVAERWKEDDSESIDVAEPGRVSAEAGPANPNPSRTKKPDPPFTPPPSDAAERELTQELREIRRLLASEPQRGRAALGALETGRCLVSDSPYHAAVLLSLYARELDHGAAIEFGDAALARYGEHPDLCVFLVRPLLVIGSKVRARRLAKVAAAAYPESPRALSGLAVALRGADPTKAREAAMRALLCGATALDVRRIALHAVPESEFEREAMVASVTDDHDDQQFLRELLGDGADVDRSDRLVPDLEFMLDLLKACGVEPVLLLYPSPKCRAVNRTLAALSRERGWEPVDLETRFRELLSDHAPDELFCADGAHPGDLGYRWMAEAVADRLLASLR